MLRYKVGKIDALLKRLDHKIIEKALMRATNRTANKLAVEVSSRVRGRYNISAADFKKRMTVRKAVRGELSSELQITGKPIGYMSFGAQPKKVTLSRAGKRGKRWGRFRTGVSVKIMKTGGRKLVTSQPAFIAVGASGNKQVFYRDPKGAKSGKGKTKLIAMKMLSAPDMALVAEQDIAADYQFFVSSTLNQEFDHQLKFLLGETRKK